MSGVLAPTHAASSQCVFGRLRVTRLNLVLPPVPHSTGMPNCVRRSYNAHRVALTADASFNGAFAWAIMRLSTSGFFAKNTLISWVPLARLHVWHASVRLLRRLVPPCAFGWICSTCKGTSFFPQYAHVRFHFSSRYSRTSYPANSPC